MPVPLRLALVIALCAVAVRADAPVPLDLRKGSLSYLVVHKLHEVKGTTHELEGKAVLLPDGSAKVQVRAKVASFDSGNSNRDEHVREATHAVEHQYAGVRGTIEGLSLPLPGPAEKKLHAVVELNGEKQTVEIPVKLTPAEGGVRATFSFPISLEAFHVERPELFFVKVEDKVVIEGDVTFGTAK
jgi:polyisoprenoid-binding protein YceI